MPQIEYEVPIENIEYDSERGLYMIRLRARRLGKPGHETTIEITLAEFDQLRKPTAGDHIKVILEFPVAH